MNNRGRNGMKHGGRKFRMPEKSSNALINKLQATTANLRYHNAVRRLGRAAPELDQAPHSPTGRPSDLPTDKRGV